MAERRLARSVVRWGPAVLLVLGLAGLWQWYAGIAAGDGLLLPGPGEVVRAMVDDWDIISAALGVTLLSAARGLLWGSVVALGFAILVVVAPPLRRPLTRQLTILFCLPLAAIAPMLFLLLDLPGPHIAVAAIAVVFPTYIALAQGLTTRHDHWADLCAVLGAGRVAYFLRVQLPASTREVLVAARIAGPTAVLGTTLAEYFGGERGIGVLMINSLAQLNAPRAYALGAVVTVVSAAVYGIVELVARLLPWTEELTS